MAHARWFMPAQRGQLTSPEGSGTQFAAPPVLGLFCEIRNRRELSRQGWYTDNGAWWQVDRHGLVTDRSTTPCRRKKITMSVQENIRLDEEFIAAWNSHDPDRALALLSEDVVWRDVASPEPMRGKAAIRPYLQGWFTAFPDLSTTVKNRIATEDQVAAELEFTGTNSGPLRMAPGMPPMPATGKRVTGQGTYFVRIKNSKAVEVHSYPDAAGMMMQLGMMPKG